VRLVCPELHLSKRRETVLEGARASGGGLTVEPLRQPGDVEHSLRVARDVAQPKCRTTCLRFLRDRNERSEPGRVDERQGREIDGDRGRTAFERGPEARLEIGRTGQVDVASYGQDTRGSAAGVVDVALEPIGHGTVPPEPEILRD